MTKTWAIRVGLGMAWALGAVAASMRVRLDRAMQDVVQPWRREATAVGGDHRVDRREQRREPGSLEGAESHERHRRPLRQSPCRKNI